MMAENYKLLLSELGIDVAKVRSNAGKTTCPKCSHDRKKKNDPCLSVNFLEGIYNCHNCGWGGKVFEKTEYVKKEYVRPVFANRTELSKNAVDWFFKRGITQDTLIKAKVTEAKEWMPQTQKDVNTIQFNYFRDGQLINTKFRDAKKNFKLVKDAELIMYNLDAIKDVEECIICEGEIDALSWIEAGYGQVVSVPNGASKGSQKLEYLDNCYSYFENKKKIFLSTDNDAPGRELRDELARRLGASRCYMLDLEDQKDANDYLQKNGTKKLLNVLQTAKEFPIEGIFTIADSWDTIKDFWQKGLPTGCKTGDADFDRYLRFMPGELTMVTGIPGHGKSIYLDQLAIGLCLNEDWRFGVFTPESYPMEMYYLRLIKRLTGKKVSTANIHISELEAAKNWIENRFNIINPEKDGFSLDVILDKAKQLVFKKGINALIIDPWSRLESTMGRGADPGQFVSEQLVKILNFNQQNGVHTFLVAHPTKMQKMPDSQNYYVPNLYNISGSAHFFNLTQNGFTVYRNFETNKTEIHIQKVKWEHLGETGAIEKVYCSENARLFNPHTDNPHTSWLPSVATPNLTIDFPAREKAFDNPAVNDFIEITSGSTVQKPNNFIIRPSRLDPDEEPPF